MSFPHINDPMTDAERAAFYAVMIDNCRDAVVAIDRDGCVVEWNAMAKDAFGWSQSEAIGKSIGAFLIPEQHRDAHRRGMAHFLATGEGPILDRRLELSAVHRDGHELPIELTVTYLRFRATDYFVARLRDVTERRQRESRLQLQARELDHRVKNTLAIFLSIHRLLARCTTSVEDLVLAFEHRIVAYKRTHELLAVARHDGVDLRALLLSEFEPYGLERVALDGPDVFLPPKPSLTLGMCIHEMTANAAKHGCLGSATGRLTVTWHLTEADFQMDWVETGGPPPPEARPERRGFGSYLVTSVLRSDLRGTFSVRYPSTGLVGRVIIPRASLGSKP